MDFKKIVGQIQIDTSKPQKAVEEFNDVLEQIENTLATAKKGSIEFTQASRQAGIVQKMISERLKEANKYMKDYSFEIEEVATNIDKSIKGHRSQNKELQKAAASTATQTKEVKGLHSEYSQLTRSIDSADGAFSSLNQKSTTTSFIDKLKSQFDGFETEQFGEVANEVGGLFSQFGGQARMASGLGDSIGSLAGRFAEFGKLGTAGLVVASLVAIKELTSAAAEADKEMQRLQVQAQRFFAGTNADIKSVMANAEAVATFFNLEAADVLKSVSVIAREYRISSDEAFQGIEKAMVIAGDAAGEVLSRLEDNAREFRRAGVDAEQFFSIAAVDEAGGANTAVLMDAVKEFSMNLRTLDSAGKEAVQFIGGSFIKDLSSQVKTGQKNAIDAIKSIYEEGQRLGLTELQMMEVAEQVGLSSLEEIGGIGEAYKLLNDSTNSAISANQRYYNEQKQLLELQKTIDAETNKLVSQFDGLGHTLDVLSSAALAGLLSGLNAYIDMYDSARDATEDLKKGFKDMASAMSDADLEAEAKKATEQLEKLGSEGSSSIDKLKHSWSLFTADRDNDFFKIRALSQAFKSFFDEQNNGLAVAAMRTKALNDEIAKRQADDAQAQSNVGAAMKQIDTKLKYQAAMREEEVAKLRQLQSEIASTAGVGVGVLAQPATPQVPAGALPLDGFTGILPMSNKAKVDLSKSQEWLDQIDNIHIDREGILAASDAMRDFLRNVQDARNSLRDMNLESMEIQTQTLQMLPKVVADYAIEVRSISNSTSDAILQMQRQMEDEMRSVQEKINAEYAGVNTNEFENTESAAIRINERMTAQLNAETANIQGIYAAQIAAIKRQDTLRKEALSIEFFRSQLDSMANIEEYISNETLPDLLAYYKKSQDALVGDNQLDAEFKKILDREMNRFGAFLKLHADARDEASKYKKLLIDIERSLTAIQLEEGALDIESTRRGTAETARQGSQVLERTNIEQTQTGSNRFLKALGLVDIDEGTWAYKKALKDLEKENLRANANMAKQDKEAALQRIKLVEETGRINLEKLSAEFNEVTREYQTQKQRIEMLMAANVGADGGVIDSEKQMQFKNELKGINKEYGQDSADLQNRIALETQEVTKAQVSAEQEYTNAAKTEVDARAELSQVELDEEKRKQRIIKEGINTIKEASFQAAREVTEFQIAETDRQIEYQRHRIERFRDIERTRVEEQGKFIDQARSVLDAGNAEALLAEETRLEELTKKRQRFVNTQKALDAAEFASASALAIARAAAEGGGVGSFMLVAAVIAAIVGGISKIATISNQMPAFKDGGEITGGEQVIRVNEEGTEFVLNAKSYKRSPNLARAINEGRIDDSILTSQYSHNYEIANPDKSRNNELERMFEKTMRAMQTQSSTELSGRLQSRQRGEDLYNVVELQTRRRNSLAKRR